MIYLTPLPKPAVVGEPPPTEQVGFPYGFQQKGAAIPARSITVNTRLYKLVHRGEPRGIRSWGFTMGERTGVYWVHETAYAEAKRRAVQQARRLGVEYITVLP